MKDSGTYEGQTGEWIKVLSKLGVNFAEVFNVTEYSRQLVAKTVAGVETGETYVITYSKEEYVAKAVELSKEPLKLLEPRKTLRQELVESPVMKGYVDFVEKTYRELVKEKAAQYA